MAEEIEIIVTATGFDKVTSGLKNTNDALKSTATEAKKTGDAMKTTLNAGANQAGQSITNFSRILQDAPFGFIGIANNINPLVESFGRLKAESGSTGGALKALVGGLSSLGAAAPLAGIGVVILMGLGLAFAFFGAGVMMVGMGIKLAMDGISSMVAVLPQLAANLGPLISMILPIFGLAAAIMALSLSLMMLGTMGMIALPVLLALGALGAVAGGLFGGGEGGSSNDEMIAILKSIDSKVGGAPAINMDSKKVTAASNDGAARRGDSGGTKY
jgi:hypothetical protein